MVFSTVTVWLIDKIPTRSWNLQTLNLKKRLRFIFLVEGKNKREQHKLHSLWAFRIMERLKKHPFHLKERHSSNWLHSLSRTHFSLAKYIARLFWIMILKIPKSCKCLELYRIYILVHLWFICPIVLKVSTDYTSFL